jgi:hypothetical protein
VSKERISGYVPNRQVFGLIFDIKTDVHMPAVLKVWKWSTFISFERSGQAWNKIVVPEGKALIRRYGSLGVKEGEGFVPNFETYNQGRSTPIEAVGLSKLRFVDITPEFEELWNKALEWKECERWNAVGAVSAEDTASTLSLFMAKCKELNLSNVDIEQLVKENNGDYAKALAATTFGEEEINSKLAEVEEEDIPF